MWQEARKQEKKIRGIMIDFKKRAERRQAYYQRMRQDPHQLLRVYGHSCKMFLGEHSSKAVGDKLMPWQGDPEVMIDRFDVRAHLDYIAENGEQKKNQDFDLLEAQCNYERYRTLVQIDAAGAAPENYLKQLEIEEIFGKKQAESAQMAKASKSKGNTFGFVYDDSSAAAASESDSADSDEEESDLSDIDITVNIAELADEQKEQMDSLATQYGIAAKVYCKQLTNEKHEIDYVRRLEEEEEERAKLAGRKGKRARRSLRDRQRAVRMTSPLSFATRSSPTYEPYSLGDGGDDNGDTSTSSSEEDQDTGRVEFITEFGSPAVIPQRDPAASSTVSSKFSSRSSRSKSERSDHGRSHSRRDSRSSRERSKSREHSRGRSHDHSHSSSRQRSDERSRRDSSSYYSRDHRRVPHERRSRSRTRSRSRERYRSRSNRRPSGSVSPESSSSHHSSANMTTSVTKKLETVDKSKKGIGKATQLTPQEKLKLRMQKLLNRQVKEDKREAIKKTVEKEKERDEREREINDARKQWYPKSQNERDSHYHRRSPSPRESEGRDKRRRSRSHSPTY